MISEDITHKANEFVEKFINRVEAISDNGSNVWDSLFTDGKLYVPNNADESPSYKLLNRDDMEKSLLHFQREELINAGLATNQDFNSFFITNRDLHPIRGGEHVIGKLLCKVRGKKLLIAKIFILAYLESKQSIRTHTYAQCSSSIKRYELIKVLLASLNSHDIEPWWADTCTLLIPNLIISPFYALRSEEKTEDIFINELAIQFLSFIANNTIAVYWSTSNNDTYVYQKMMKDEAKLLEKEERWRAEQEAQNDQYKQQQEKKRQELISEYQTLCQEALKYTEEVPPTLKKYEYLENRWQKLDSEELEELIWTIPLTLLSKMFHKSDNGLKKWAKRERVSLPAQGFWNKVISGKVVYPNGMINIKFIQ